MQSTRVAPHDSAPVIDRRRVLQYAAAVFPLAIVAKTCPGLTAAPQLAPHETSSEKTMQAEWIGGY